MRLQPSLIASSTIASVTSRHNKAPETSRSVNPSCTPALSKSACRDRGAKRSRAFTTSNIFTLITYLEYKDKELSVMPQTFYPFFASLTPFLPHSPSLFPSLPGRAPILPVSAASPASGRHLAYQHETYILQGLWEGTLSFPQTFIPVSFRPSAVVHDILFSVRPDGREPDTFQCRALRCVPGAIPSAHSRCPILQIP